MLSWAWGGVEGGANNVQVALHTEVMLIWTCLRPTSCPGLWVRWRGGANSVQATSHTEVMLLWTCLRSTSCPGFLVGLRWG